MNIDTLAGEGTEAKGRLERNHWAQPRRIRRCSRTGLRTRFSAGHARASAPCATLRAISLSQPPPLQAPLASHCSEGYPETGAARAFVSGTMAARP